MAPRTAPPDRFDALLGAAREVFARQGVAGAQMADVAKAMGVAKGTLYLYVESKEALFGAVIEQLASGGGPVAMPDRLPIPTPRFGRVLARVAEAVRVKMQLPALERALARPAAGPKGIRAELREIVAELAGLLRVHCDEIRLVERCAADAPELARVWYQEGRVAVVERLARYLDRRASAGRIPAVHDSRVQARLLLETLTVWIVHRAGDPAPQDLDEARAHEMLIDFAVGGLQGGARR